MSAVPLERLVRHLDGFLDAAAVSDACPNGLQVEGTRAVSRVALGVTSSLAFLEKARDAGADAAIVHHGLFWRGDEMLRIERTLRARLAVLFESGMSLLAYHLPLDGHLEVGNNAVLARRLGAAEIEPAFPWGGITAGVTARFAQSVPASEVFRRIEEVTSRVPLVIDAGPDEVSRIGVVSGAAAGLIGDAARMGLDLFLTGEPREASTHIAREERIHFVAAGHHATERFGVQALAEHLERELSLSAHFIDIENPV